MQHHMVVVAAKIHRKARMTEDIDLREESYELLSNLGHSHSLKLETIMAS